MAPARGTALAFTLLWLAAPARAAGPGIDPADLDPHTPACEDFYRHANGGWLARNPVPEAYSGWGVSNEVRMRNRALLRQILQQAQQAEPEDHPRWLLGRFHARAMDTELLEKQGLQPLRPLLRRVELIGSVDELTELLMEWNAEGMGLLFETEVYPDLKQSRTNLLYIYQGSLGLPERSYYLDPDPDSRRLRKAYLRHIGRMLVLSGTERKTAARQARAVLALETRLARAAMSPEQLRLPENTYRPMGVREADKHTPALLWSRYLAELELDGLERFSFSQPEYFSALDQALVEVPLDVWKAWLRWSLLSDAAPYLAEQYQREDFDFYGRVLEGARKPRARWMRVLDEVNLWLGEALGRLYVQQAFPPETRQRVLAMVDDLRRALRQRLQTMPWMSSETRRQALAKLEKLRIKIGHPQQWQDYRALQLPDSSYLANVQAARRFRFRQQLARLHRPVDPGLWQMNPQEVNAYYDPTGNEVVFPAGILQPPYFDPRLPAAYNYGAMGAIIGHELLHAFDDEGSRYDAEGNLRNWWTELDRQRFRQRTEALVRQFDAFELPGGIRINGRLTLGENIADLGGLQVAWDALELHLGQAPDEAEARLFFHAYALSWRRNDRPEALRLMVRTDEHAPAPFRVNGPVANLAPFHRAFGCRPGQALYREENERVHIW